VNEELQGYRLFFRLHIMSYRWKGPLWIKRRKIHMLKVKNEIVKTYYILQALVV